jgi:hypothetical protein
MAAEGHREGIWARKIKVDDERGLVTFTDTETDEVLVLSPDFHAPLYHFAMDQIRRMREHGWTGD